VRVRRTPKSDELLVADARLGPPQPLAVSGGSEEAVVWLVGAAGVGRRDRVEGYEGR
jgi:hypothetical protein